MRKIVLPLVIASLVVTGAAPASAGWDEGVAAFTSKNFDQAIAEFQELVKQNPEGWRGHYMLGLSLEQKSRKEEALHHLRKAYDLNPNELSVKMALGRSYHNVRRYGDVSKLLGSVDASALPGAQQVALYQMRGKAKMETGNASGALSDFAALAKLKPNDADVQYSYGTTALSQGQTTAGINALARASQLAPKDAGKKRAYIQALIKKGRETRDKAAKKDAYGKAAVLARELVAADPSYESQILKISAELGAGLYPQAIQTGKAAVAKKGNDWLAHYYLGQAYTSAGQFQDSVAPLETAKGLTSKPDDLKLIWTQLGFAYEKQKKYSQSIEAYQFAGNQAGVARVKKNEETDRFNALVEQENKAIKAMEEEAKKLEEELKALESGGGGGP